VYGGVTKSFYADVGHYALSSSNTASWPYRTAVKPLDREGVLPKNPSDPKCVRRVYEKRCVCAQRNDSVPRWSSPCRL